ncbi:shikimate dehydrogenase [Paenibacillus pectinilyticus]|uniref:Shikimate dehydrogenase (NADP(+)) n=1 Tax=Paenibacillus pectinilyticus TaxID=512399 RepID=A0A1C1A9C2_9BACL|nr:shikimate dehydrogenase [Paenibacillus pectinilyticus]OCT17202.1 shikimate dehydrogenase [Paenibacillus pectinilyticus]
MEKLRTIDSHTVLYGVFGDPIRHSRSPIMLNRAFQETGVNGVYAAFHVKPEELGEAVRGIKALGYRGVNVTIPHKVDVMNYLDEIDEGAMIVGAVNTIVNEAGKLKGFNTDGIGYVRSLKEETGIELKGKRVLVLGAGGAARGVAYALAKEGASCIYIANRTRERAVELAQTIGAFTETVGLGMDELEDVVDQVEFVLNTTSAGMHPNVDELPLPLHLLRSHHLVSDLIYNPRITRFLRKAEAIGARIHGGLGMFIYQGAYAFEYWTGTPAPVEAMRQVVEQSLTE